MDILGGAAATGLFLLQCLVTFAVSAALFDALHYLLHRWQQSRFALLRTFSSWHWIHHRFLTLEMKVDPRFRWKNVWFHILPEFVTGLAGTLLFLLVFPPAPVIAVVVLRLLILAVTIKDEGMDIHHMSMDRVSGQQNLWWVGPDYHAMHHIYPNNFFSSFFNIFDLIVGKSCQLEGRRFLVTGASGAFGSALVKRLEKAGAIVETAKFGVDYRAGELSAILPKLERAEVLVLAHGAKSVDCWDANYTTFVELIDAFRTVGKPRLTPPEVWALGSEIELHGDFGFASLRDYSASKKAFAARARDFYASPDLIYRHIVPSAFTSSMGRGPISASMAVAMAMFLIQRNFRYVPVTVTTLAFWNYFRFILQPVSGQVLPAKDSPAEPQDARPAAKLSES